MQAAVHKDIDPAAVRIVDAVHPDPVHADPDVLINVVHTVGQVFTAE